MSMDLWYDLAVRELVNLDAHVAELIKDERAETPGKVEVEAEAVAVVGVDFF
jgi:hypothetical protein